MTRLAVFDAVRRVGVVAGGAAGGAGVVWVQVEVLLTSQAAVALSAEAGVARGIADGRWSGAVAFDACNCRQCVATFASQTVCRTTRVACGTS